MAALHMRCYHGFLLDLFLYLFPPSGLVGFELAAVNTGAREYAKPRLIRLFLPSLFVPRCVSNTLPLHRHSDTHLSEGN